jgi:hypothetical protein
MAGPGGHRRPGSANRGISGNFGEPAGYPAIAPRLAAAPPRVEAGNLPAPAFHPQYA